MYKRWTNAQVSTSINYINCNPRPELLHLRNTILGSDREMEREKEREEEEEIALLFLSFPENSQTQMKNRMTRKAFGQSSVYS